MDQEIFKSITNTVLDLQRAHLQAYDQLLGKLARLLAHPELRSYNAELTAGLDLEAFLQESRQTGGSMVGSARLVWPIELHQELGMKLLLIERLGEDPRLATNIGFFFFNSGKKIIDSLRALTSQVISPFVRDYESYVRAKEGTSTEKTLDTVHNPSSITNFGIMVMNSQNVAMENIHNLVQASQDKALGDFLEALAKEIVAADLPAQKSAEMLEKVETLAQQSAMAPQDRKGWLVKACWKQLVEDADSINKISTFLTVHAPMVAGFFKMVIQ